MIVFSFSNLVNLFCPFDLFCERIFQLNLAISGYRA